MKKLPCRSRVPVGRDPDFVPFRASSWHGGSQYVWDEDTHLGIYTIKFHYESNEAEEKTYCMTLMKGTSSFSDGYGNFMVPMEN